RHGARPTRRRDAHAGRVLLPVLRSEWARRGRARRSRMGRPGVVPVVPLLGRLRHLSGAAAQPARALGERRARDRAARRRAGRGDGAAARGHRERRDRQGGAARQLVECTERRRAPSAQGRTRARDPRRRADALAGGQMIGGALVVFLVLAFLVLFVLSRTAVVVPQQSAYVVERLGRYRATLDAGFHILLPFVDAIRYRHSLKEHAVDIPEQVCITKDNVQVHVDGVLYMKVMNPERASY